MMCYAMFFAELLEAVIVELSPIICDWNSGNTKLAHNGRLDKPSDLLFGDGCQRLSFYPLGEVIDNDHQEPYLSLTEGKWADDVDSPLVEGPRRSCSEPGCTVYLRTVGTYPGI